MTKMNQMNQMQVISTLQYDRTLHNIEKLTNDHVLHVYDVFDQQYINQILKKGTPGAIVSDHLLKPPYSDPIPFFGLPLWVANNTSIIIDGYKFDDNISTINCFNFMINKKQINRFLCIKFVEWFKLSNFDYTWSALDQKFDMSDILTEIALLGNQSPLDQATKSFILSPIKLEKRFIEFSEQTLTATDGVKNHGVDRWGNNGLNKMFLSPPPHIKVSVPASAQMWVENYGGNSWTWRNGLNKMFLSSAISLITESLKFEKTATFTEKTIYSVLGLTFPIWVGGYNQATEWKNIGFDVFDDIIDHSYQSYDTLIERCYYAFANNLDLLSNKDKSAKLRLLCKDRLLKNRNLLLNNQLEIVVNNKISTYPQELQLCMPEILKYFKYFNV